MSLTTSTVAANIRAEMARRQISQQTVGLALGLSQPAVSRRLRGITPFDVNELSTVAGLLGVPATSLLPVETAGAA